MIKRKKEHRTVSKELKIICYAGNDTVNAEREVDLQKMLNQFHNIRTKYHKNISSEKTKIFVIAEELIKCKLVVEKKITVQEMEIEYLSIKFCTGGGAPIIDQEGNQSCGYSKPHHMEKQLSQIKNQYQNI